MAGKPILSSPLNWRTRRWSSGSITKPRKSGIRSSIVWHAEEALGWRAEKSNAQTSYRNSADCMQHYEEYFDSVGLDGVSVGSGAPTGSKKSDGLPRREALD